MTTLYGALVGTPKQATPIQLVDKTFQDTVNRILVRDTITLAAAASGTTIQLAVLGWETVIDPDACRIWWGALGASVTLSIGDVTYPAALYAATSASSAGNAVPMAAVTIGNYFTPLWQALGYASLAAAQAVGKQAVLLITIGGAAATGVVTWYLGGEPRL